MVEGLEPGLSTPVKRIGSHPIGAFPFDPVRIECLRCGRAGRYALAGLIERFGASAALPDVLLDLAFLPAAEELLPAMRRTVRG